MSDNVIDSYETLGFEETEIEDGFTALSCEIDPEGNYALLTNDEGTMPANLKQPVLFSYYTTDGSFQWSTGFKNFFVFKEYWSQAETAKEKLAVVWKYRESKEWYKELE